MQCCNLFIFELTKSRDGVDMHDKKAEVIIFSFRLHLYCANIQKQYYL